jgi:hypothetical protein
MIPINSRILLLKKMASPVLFGADHGSVFNPKCVAPRALTAPRMSGSMVSVFVWCGQIKSLRFLEVLSYSPDLSGGFCLCVAHCITASAVSSVLKTAEVVTQKGVAFP